MKVLQSTLDESVNYVESMHPEPGAVETRYVRRGNKDILYLSSQTGCEKLCKMCWLTATGQTKFRNLEYWEFEKQLIVGGQHFENKIKTLGEPLHINFMARGEPLSNPVLALNWNQLMGYANTLFYWKNPIVPIVSSIIPNDKFDLGFFRGKYMPRLYWSVYSINPEFRRRWLPNAMPFDDCVNVLKHYHQMGGEIRVHFPFIEGQNDSESDVVSMAQALHQSRLPLKINIIRYNPPNDKSKESPPEIIRRNIDLMRIYLPYAEFKMIDRVGTDVYASCGQFIS